MSRSRSAPRPDRRAVAAEIRAKRAQIRAAVRARPDAQRRRRRRWGLAAGGVILLAMWLLRDCSCSAPPPPPPQTETRVAPVGFALGAEDSVPPTPPPPMAPVPRRERPAFEAEAPGPLPWIPSFRRQVAARSPRLASCFVGAVGPGTLKWTASVEPTGGRVFDHTLEPTVTGYALSAEQRACVLAVLSAPSYRLQAGQPRATPPRVALVIEF